MQNHPNSHSLLDPKRLEPSPLPLKHGKYPERSNAVYTILRAQLSIKSVSREQVIGHSLEGAAFACFLWVLALAS